MLIEFFMDHSRIEPSDDGSSYIGSVPDLPEIRVEAQSRQECRMALAEAIADLLAVEAGRSAADVNLFDAEELSPSPEGQALTGKQPDQPAPRYTDIIYEKRDWVARLTINRPDLYNAYSSVTLREMAEAFRDAADDPEVAVLVLTGAGDKAFCTGSDIKEHSEAHLGDAERSRGWVALLIDAHQALRGMGKPTIARINGIVAGGGNELNLSCDLAIAADHARFMHIETSVGLAAVTGAAQWLPIVIGERRAREMLMTGEPISANKALLWGLVNDVVPNDELDAAVESLCKKLIDRFPECTRFTKQQLDFWKNLSWDATSDQVSDWLAEHFSGPEAAEGMSALAHHTEIDVRAFRNRMNRPDAPADEKEEELPSADSTPERKCPGCGAGDLPVLFEFCGYCGTRIASVIE